MKFLKRYIKPIVLAQDVECNALQSSSYEKDFKHRTIILDGRWGIPSDGEKLLIVHENCQILKYDKIFGLQTASFQYITCCVTDKRIIFVPQDTLPNQNIVSLIGSLMDVNPVGKYILMREIYDKRINTPYAIARQHISRIDVGMDEYPTMRGVSMFVNGERLLLGCDEYDYAFDIQGAFYNPDWDWND